VHAGLTPSDLNPKLKPSHKVSFYLYLPGHGGGGRGSGGYGGAGGSWGGGSQAAMEGMSLVGFLFFFFTRVCGLFLVRGLLVLQRRFSFDISSEFWWGDQRLCKQDFGGNSSRVEQ